MSPTEPQFRVCRCCRFLFEWPRPTPFCDSDCAATWALTLIDHNRLLAKEKLLKFYVAACPQGGYNAEKQDAEYAAQRGEIL